MIDQRARTMQVGDKMEYIGTEIIQLAEKDYEQWDKLLNTSPQSEVFHTSKWLVLAERYTNTKLILLVARKRGEIIGGIPFFHQHKYGNLLNVLLSPPYPNLTLIPNLGPVVANYDDLKGHRKESRLMDIQSALDEYIRSRIRPDIVRIYTSTNMLDVRRFKWSGYSVVPEYTYMLNIGDKDKIMEGFKTSARKSIAKAEKMGIEIEESNIEGYRNILQSVFGRFEEKGNVLNVSEQYLLDLYKEFYPNNLRVFIARYGEEVVGGQVLITYKSKVMCWIGAVRSDLRGVYPQDLILWKSIEWAAEHDFKYFENVGANTPSISVYKSRFGFDLKPYFVLSRSSSKYKLANSAVGTAQKIFALFHRGRVKHPVERQEIMGEAST